MNLSHKLLTALTLAFLAGCQTTIEAPEVGRELRDYQAAPAVAEQAVAALPEDLGFASEQVGGQWMACTPARFALEQFVIAGQANTAALKSMLAAYRAKEREAVHLLHAGRSAEEMAELYRGLYLDAASGARIREAAGLGGLGLVLLFLGAGAL